MRVCENIKLKNKEKPNKSLLNNAAKMKIIKSIVNSKFNNNKKKTNNNNNNTTNFNQDHTGRTPILQLMTSTIATTDQKEQPYQAKNFTGDNNLSLSLATDTELNCKKETTRTVINRSVTNNNNHHHEYDRSLTQMHNPTITTTKTSQTPTPVPVPVPAPTSTSTPTTTNTNTTISSTPSSSSSFVLSPSSSLPAEFISVLGEQSKQSVLRTPPSVTVPSVKNTIITTNTTTTITNNNNNIHSTSSVICASTDTDTDTVSILIPQSEDQIKNNLINNNDNNEIDIDIKSKTNLNQHISVINNGKSFVKCNVVTNNPNKQINKLNKEDNSQYLENNNYELTNSVIIPNYNSIAYQQQQLQKQQQLQQQHQQEQHHQLLTNFYEEDIENIYVTEQITKEQKQQQQQQQQQQQNWLNTYNSCVYDLSLHNQQNLVNEEQQKTLLNQQQSSSTYSIRCQNNIIDENNSDTYLLNNHRSNSNNNNQHHIMPSNLTMYATYGSNPHEHHYSHHLQPPSSHIHGHSIITHTPTNIDEVIQDTLKDECMDDHNGSTLSYCTLTAVTDPTGLKDTYYHQQLPVNETHFSQHNHHHHHHNHNHQSALLQQHLQATSNCNHQQQHSSSTAASSCGESPPPSTTLAHSGINVDLSGNRDMNALQSFTTLTSANNNHRDLYGNLTPEHTSNLYFTSPLSPGLQIR